MSSTVVDVDDTHCGSLQCVTRESSARTAGDDREPVGAEGQRRRRANGERLIVDSHGRVARVGSADADRPLLPLHALDSLWSTGALWPAAADDGGKGASIWVFV